MSGTADLIGRKAVVSGPWGTAPAKIVHAAPYSIRAEFTIPPMRAITLEWFWWQPGHERHGQRLDNLARMDKHSITVAEPAIA